MRTEPYIPAAERKRKLWSDASKLSGMTVEEIQELYIQIFFTSMEANAFVDLLRRKEITREQLMKYQSQMQPRIHTVRTEHDQGMCEAVEESLNNSDRKNYDCKQIIEVGDEVLAGETKTFCFSKKEYITKGEWYKVISLNDDGVASFCAVTETNIPGEQNWENVWGISVVRREGKIIWDRWEGTSLSYSAKKQESFTEEQPSGT